jgi:chromosome partitioning protein
MQKIVILNSKGGSGKTTVATNLAACCSTIAGRHAALMDLDPQGSAMRWLRKRPQDRVSIHGIAAFERSASVTRTFQLRVPTECDTLVVDTPAAIDPHTLPDVTRGAHAILVPVMPSEIDIHATAKCVADLLLIAKVRRSEGRLGIVANRVRSNTLVSQSLMRFLERLDIPLVATLRDSQNYLRSAELGVGISELPRWQAWPDLAEWERLLEWLRGRVRAPAPRGGPAIVTEAT